MTTKRTKISQNVPGDQTASRKADSFWKGKDIDELIQEQSVRPIKNEEDLARISGGLEDWDDIDEFLKEVHRPTK
jgi:hypothetical protein